MMFQNFVSSSILLFLIGSCCVLLSDSSRTHARYVAGEKGKNGKMTNHDGALNHDTKGWRLEQIHNETDPPLTPLSGDFVHPRGIQVFDMTRGKSPVKYVVKLEKILTGDVDVGVDYDLQIVAVPTLVTLHHRMNVRIGRDEYCLISKHVPGTNPLGSRSWRLALKGDDKAVLYTIQRKHLALHNKATCTLGTAGCKVEWKVYPGKRRQKRKHVFVGVADSDDKGASVFKFFRHGDLREDGTARENWVGKVVHNPHDEKGFKAFIQPSEDAALMLVSFIGINYIDNPVRVQESRPLPEQVRRFPGKFLKKLASNAS